MDQIAKNSPEITDWKIREIDWCYLCLKQFEIFWIWSAINHRKRKGWTSSETFKYKAHPRKRKEWTSDEICLKKVVKSPQVLSKKAWQILKAVTGLEITTYMWTYFVTATVLTNLIMERNRKQSPETDVMLICWMLLEENLWNHIKWIRFWRIFEMLNHYACSRLTPRPSSAAPGAWPPCTATSAWS